MDYRVIIIILDSVGIGALPDANKYGDTNSNTLGNIAKATGGLNLPNLAQLGLGNIAPIKGISPSPYPTASYGKMAERSAGKDTISGHWELMGIVNNTPFPTYPDGFPKEIIESFKSAIARLLLASGFSQHFSVRRPRRGQPCKGTDILGNKPASGTEIIIELGKKHIETGFPIVYTSADSVFQIAAHEKIIPIEKLYKICEIARNILVSPHNVARVIARPFIGKPNSFKRTDRRRDFSIKPPKQILLNYIEKTLGIGKIWDIFAGEGITDNIHIKNNREGIQKTIWAIKKTKKYKLIFTNLIDFDMLYGHRNDIKGYYKALREFDNYLPKILEAMQKKDILIITADHGCDPTTKSTDHSREYVPLLVYGTGINPGINLGLRTSFSDVAQTLAELWGLPQMPNGVSFLRKLL